MATVNINKVADDLIDDAIITSVAEAIRIHQSQLPERIMTRQPGHLFIQELLQSKSQDRIRRALRMNIDTFCALRDWVLEHAKLENGRHITVEEKLAIFIYIVSIPASNWNTVERFSHSSYTITQLVYLLQYINIY